MMTEHGTGRHLTDAEVLRYVDGEGADGERDGWNRHLEACDRCAAELDTLRTEDRVIRDWLERAHFEADAADRIEPPTVGRPDIAPAPAAGGSAGRAARPRPWLRAAVIVGLIAGALATVPPVRAWVGGWISPLLSSGEETPPEAVDPPPVDPQILRFVPDAGPFTVAFEAPVDGTLRLARADGSEAVLTLAGRSEPVVSPTGLRIDAARPGDDYELRLPARTTSVRLWIGRREVSVGAGELDRGLVVSLAGNGVPGGSSP
jgi:hypothetical protein